MDRNTFTGMFLIMVILFGSFYLMKPSAEQIKKEQQAAHADSVKRALIKGAKTAIAAQKTDTGSTRYHPNQRRFRRGNGWYRKVHHP
jgi:YidC/Oxa1 family membrane protein insertase